jgi:hypothetical protein
VEEHGGLPCEEIYPKVEDGDVVGLDEFAVGLVGGREEREGVVAGSKPSNLAEG